MNPVRRALLYPALAILIALAAPGCGDSEDGAVPNAAPTAVAGDNATVATGSPVTLDGRSSSDPEGSVLTYLWSFVSRPPGSRGSGSRRFPGSTLRDRRG